MVTVRYIGNRILTVTYRGRAVTLQPGQLIEVPRKALKRIVSVKGKHLFERVEESSDFRIERLEKVVKHLVKEALAHGWERP